MKKQPTKQRRTSSPNELKATADRKMPIRASAGSTNTPAPDYVPAPVKSKPVPKVPKVLPTQNPGWTPPSAPSPTNDLYVRGQR